VVGQRLMARPVSTRPGRGPVAEHDGRQRRTPRSGCPPTPIRPTASGTATRWPGLTPVYRRRRRPGTPAADECAVRAALHHIKRFLRHFSDTFGGSVFATVRLPANRRFDRGER
jgi:hypothetical protein